MRVVNLHTASIDGIAPGAEGDLPDAPPVWGLVDAGLLLVAGGTPPAATAEPTEQLRAELATSHAAVEALRAELALAQTAVEALRAELAAPPPPPANPSKSSKSSRAPKTPDAPPSPAEG